MSFLLFALLIFSGLQAQTTIVEDLESVSVTGNEGVIVIFSDPAITALLGTSSPGAALEEGELVSRSGYRLQVFMGNNPRTAKNEAFRKQEMIRELFPELTTYANYDAPNWKLLAGDFLTREEAQLYKQKLQKAFPQFGKEIYTIQDTVKIAVNK